MTKRINYDKDGIYSGESDCLLHIHSWEDSNYYLGYSDEPFQDYNLIADSVNYTPEAEYYNTDNFIKNPLK